MGWALCCLDQVAEVLTHARTRRRRQHKRGRARPAPAQLDLRRHESWLSSIPACDLVYYSRTTYWIELETNRFSVALQASGYTRWFKLVKHTAKADRVARIVEQRAQRHLAASESLQPAVSVLEQTDVHEVQDRGRRHLAGRTLLAREGLPAGLVTARLFDRRAPCH